MRSCEVPRLSSSKDCILEMWTPNSRCIPEHSMQTMTPKLVDSHVASGKKHEGVEHWICKCLRSTFCGQRDSLEDPYHWWNHSRSTSRFRALSWWRGRRSAATRRRSVEDESFTTVHIEPPRFTCHLVVAIFAATLELQTESGVFRVQQDGHPVVKLLFVFCLMINNMFRETLTHPGRGHGLHCTWKW